MKTASVNTVHSTNSYQSKPLLRGITQTNLHGQNIAGTSLHSSNSNPIDGLSYLAMILSHVFSKINLSFNTLTKRLKENKKKYDELSALVKPVDEVVDKMANLAINHAGDPKFADPTTSSSGLTDDELQKIIDLVQNLQSSSAPDLARLKRCEHSTKIE